MGKPLKISDQGKPWANKRPERKVSVRDFRKRILLITEDMKSSRYYFEEWNQRLPLGELSITPVGTGFNTQSLVNEVEAIQLREEGKLKNTGEIKYKFDEIWLLFDKDDFRADQFDNAVFSGEKKKKCHVAWSNECFELWYLLHYCDQQTPIGREAIYGRLSGFLNVNDHHSLKGEVGKKIHQRLARNASCSEAIVRAKKLHGQWQQSPDKNAPWRQNPCTLVYLLVETLLKTIQK